MYRVRSGSSAVVGAWAIVALGQLAILLVTPGSEYCEEGVECPPNRLLVEDSGLEDPGVGDPGAAR